MSAITVRNLPHEVHRALRIRAARHGRSTEAEVRDILEQAVPPGGRLKLGTTLAGIGREAGGVDFDVAPFQALGLRVIDPWGE